MLKNKKTCFDYMQVEKDNLKPVILNDLHDEKTVITFNDYFDHAPIVELINNIEAIRQTGGYSDIDLYFTSDGGDIDYLFMLADYLNNIDDIQINIIVNGMVASAGFYILLMIDNTKNIKILFNKFCRCLIHLGDTYISARSQLSQEDCRYNFDKFHANDINNINKFFKEEIFPKLNLSKKDIKHLNEGRDLILDSDEFEEIVTNYRNKQYYNSEDSIGDYLVLLQQKIEIDNLLEQMDSNFDKYSDKETLDTLNELLGIVEDEEEEESEVKDKK